MQEGGTNAVVITHTDDKNMTPIDTHLQYWFYQNFYEKLFIGVLNVFANQIHNCWA